MFHPCVNVTVTRHIPIVITERIALRAGLPRATDG